MRAIGPPLTTEESEAFIAALRGCIGVRFWHQGRDPAIGLDCAGLPQWAMKSIGRPVFDLPAYGREPHKDGLRRALLSNFGPPVPRDSMRAGDVVLMRFTVHSAPRHIGVITDYPEGGFAIIHSHEDQKMVKEHRIDARRMAFIVEVYRP
jgi:cell wall-associated NlpC family hydrolase